MMAGVLVVAAVAGLSAFLIALLFAAARKYRANLEHLAVRVGGRIVHSFWNGDALEWENDGVPARLRFFMGTDKAPPWTRLQFQWAPEGMLRVAPEGLFTGIRKFFGAQDLEIGDAAFDARYLIQGSPPTWVRETLNPDVRRGLDTLFELGASFWRGKGIRLDAGPTGVTLFCQRNLVQSREELLLFVDQGLAVLRRLRGGGSFGVLSAESAAAEGRCPVCGHLLEDPEHRCDACATRHHEECWSYFGGCAIYACSRGGGVRQPLKKS
jgi:hypothetical protein